MQDQRDPTRVDHAERTFALNMRRLREQRGWSQTALADRLDERGIKIDGTAVTRIERHIQGREGARSIRLGEAVVIAEVFGTPLEKMLTEESSLREEIREKEALREQLEMMVESTQREWAAINQEIEQLRGQLDSELGRVERQLCHAKDKAMALDQEASDLRRRQSEAYTRYAELTEQLHEPNPAEAGEIAVARKRTEAAIADYTERMDQLIKEMFDATYTIRKLEREHSRLKGGDASIEAYGKDL